MRLLLTAAFTFLAGAAQAGATERDSEKPLLVLLQGDQRAEILAAARAVGAEITHDLPIISAIGARMSAQQLAEVRKQPFVERIIDDLAFNPLPEVKENEDCPLSGALQLRWEGSSARWRLFNKGSEQITPKDVELSWPDTLGTLQAASAGQTELAFDGVAAESGSLRLATQGWTIDPGVESSLEMRFSHPPVSLSAAQNATTLKVNVSDDCSAELIASYADPYGDTYYPTVSGAALLQRHGVTGAGVTVAVLDSGLWETPAHLVSDTQGRPRILARYDAIAGREVDEAVDESGHGTHMTSVIADSRPVTAARGVGYRGVAPDVSLVVVKAFDAHGEAGFLDLVRGVQWVVDNRERFDIKVLNLSFASRPRWPYWDDPVNQAVMRAWEAGITVIAAAGNEGPEPMTVGSPGNLPYLITVGAITDSWTVDTRTDDYLPDFSSRGPTPSGHIKPDLVAYGGHIAGIIEPGTTLAGEFPEYFLNDGSFVMTGSSQAAAVVSGLAALLLQAEPEARNDDIKCMLMSSAEPAISADGRLAYSPFLQGSGLANVGRAITLGERGCGNSGLDLSDDIARSSHFEGPAIFPQDGSPPRLPGAEKVINPVPPENGASDSRRWGAEAHVDRLADPSLPSPVDWVGQLRSEKERIRALAAESP